MDCLSWAHCEQKDFKEACSRRGGSRVKDLDQGSRGMWKPGGGTLVTAGSLAELYSEGRGPERLPACPSSASYGVRGS